MSVLDLDLKESRLSMSNMDRSIDEGMDELLRKGEHYCQHAAWNFCGYVWFEDGMFHEEVWRNKHPGETMSAPTLRELMEIVNDKYGWE